MKLDSYEKASQDVVDFLKIDSSILVINSIYFRLIIAAAQENNMYAFNALSYECVDILDYIPNIFEEIEVTLPHPRKDALINTHFVTELIGQYGRTWIPVASPFYKKAITVSFADDVNMVEWQRHLRSKYSKDITELTVLSVDPSKQVRELATKRLKTL